MNADTLAFCDFASGYVWYIAKQFTWRFTGNKSSAVQWTDSLTIF